ncbi:MAG: peroxiredoxin-like family protein [Xanthomonadales bacterium]|nr:peroxiredoxin-like family protein [Xanthomonadales bacterium]
MITKLLAAAAMVAGLNAQALGADEGRTAIHESSTQVQPLLPGMEAPAFEVLTVEGEPFRFEPGALEKPVILTFFRGGWCPYCNLYLSELREAQQPLEDLGFDLWFVSVDQPEKLYASLEDPDIGYTIFSDARLDATRSFGIAFRVPDALVERYREFGIDLEEASGETHHVLPAPSLFLIGEDGLVHFQYTNPDYRVRLHPDVLIAAAKAYRQDADARLQRLYDEKKKTQ